MEGFIILLIAIAIYGGIAWGCYSIAVSKNRDGAVWALLGLIGGLIPLIVIACLPDKK